MYSSTELLSLKFRQRGFAEWCLHSGRKFFKSSLPHVAQNKNVNPLATKNCAVQDAASI